MKTFRPALNQTLTERVYSAYKFMGDNLKVGVNKVKKPLMYASLLFGLAYSTPSCVTTTEVPKTRVAVGNVSFELEPGVNLLFDDQSKGYYTDDGLTFETNYKNKLARVTISGKNIYCENCTPEDVFQNPAFAYLRAMAGNSVKEIFGSTLPTK